MKFYVTGQSIYMETGIIGYILFVCLFVLYTETNRRPQIGTDVKRDREFEKTKTKNKKQKTPDICCKNMDFLSIAS